MITLSGRDLILLGLVLAVVGLFGTNYYIKRDLDNQRAVNTQQSATVNQNAGVLANLINILRGTGVVPKVAPKK